MIVIAMASYNLTLGSYFYSPTSSKANVGDWNRGRDGH